MEQQGFFDEAMAAVGLPLFTMGEGDSAPVPANEHAEKLEAELYGKRVTIDNEAATITQKADPYAPYSGEFPRKRHSHRCDGCTARGHRPVACYKSKCSLGRRVRSCRWCR